MFPQSLQPGQDIDDNAGIGWSKIMVWTCTPFQLSFYTTSLVIDRTFKQIINVLYDNLNILRIDVLVKILKHAKSLTDFVYIRTYCIEVSMEPLKSAL